MYSFLYGTIKPRYPLSKVMFSDTDSFLLQIFTRDIYEDLQLFSQLFDFSNYPKDHPLYDKSNAKKVGLFKDESKGSLILEWIGLRAKLYSILHLSGKNSKSCKGISRVVKEKAMRHEQFKQALFEDGMWAATMVRIGSENHNLYTYRVKKVALSPMDQKRYLLEGTHDTLALGHWRARMNFL